MGGKASFTIVLKTRPKANVSVALSSSNPNEGTVSPAMVTFTPDNFAAPQMVTVTGVDDKAPDGNQAYKIITAPASSTDATYNGFDAFDVGVTNIDDETAGITVTPTMGLITNESGNEATFTVVLNSAPKNNVTVPIASSDTHEGTVGPAMLTFTPQNWKAPQEVTVTGVDDPIADGEKAYKVTVGPATSGDPSYNGVKGADVDVTNEDNDEPGFTLKPTSGLMTNEDGQMTTFTIVLNLRPTANVVVGLSSSNAAEGTVSPAMVTFTPDNWKAPQIVTVTGIDDSVADGNQVYNVITGAAKSDDPGYNNLDPPDIQAINVDNDSPGITAKPKTGLMTHENGMSTTFTLVLNSKPSGDVVLNLASSAPTEGNVTPKKVDVHQRQLERAADHHDHRRRRPDARRQPALLHRHHARSGHGRPGLRHAHGRRRFGHQHRRRPGGHPRAAADGSGDDRKGRVGRVHDRADVAANGQRHHRADQQRHGRRDVSPASRHVHVRQLQRAADGDRQGRERQRRRRDAALQDRDRGGDERGSALQRHQPAGREPSPTPTTTRPASRSRRPRCGLTTTEAGGTATFTVVLNSQPTADVTIALSRAARRPKARSARRRLTFTAANWNAPQTVTVTGVDDAVADGNQPYTHRHGAATSTDAAYNGLDAARRVGHEHGQRLGRHHRHAHRPGSPRPRPADGDVHRRAQLAAHGQRHHRALEQRHDRGHGQPGER